MASTEPPPRGRNPRSEEASRAGKTSWKRWLVATSILGVVVMTSGAAAGVKRYYDLWTEYESLRKQLDLDSYISFAAEDDAHPSVDPEKARPLFAIGSEVVLRGKASTSVIRAIEITVRPVHQNGQDKLEHRLDFASEPAQGVVPFEWSFKMPAEGPIREVTIKLIPHERAQSAVKNRSTYRVLVAGQQDGALVDVSDDEGPKIISAEQVKGTRRVFVTVKARTGRGSYVTIAASARGGAVETVATPPRYVNKRGDEQTFELLVGPNEAYEVTPYASYSEETLSFTRIRTQQLSGVRIGESKTVPMLPAD